MKKSSEKSPRTPLRERFQITKEKLITSALVAFTLPFVLLICSSFSVFFSNYEQLNIQLRNFVPLFSLLAAMMFLFVFLLLLITKGYLHNILFALGVGFVTAAVIQSIVTNLTFEGLPGDGNVPPPSDTKILINSIVWILFLLCFLVLGILYKKLPLAKSVMCFLLILTLVMQTAGLIPAAIEYASVCTSEDNDIREYYLTTENMFEVSTKENVLVFIVDRFDRDYFLELQKDYPEYIDSLDGFTYYEDNISTYPRTYPAVVSMLTGEKTDFSTSRPDFFESSYKDCSFFKDMLSNDYKLNLYIPYFYAYDDARVFEGVASNLSEEGGYYTITRPVAFAKMMMNLSTYFWAPEGYKSTWINSNSFTSVVALEGDESCYNMNDKSDPEIYKELMSSGLTTQSEKNTFSVLHLRGCHNPFTMDENCNLVPTDSVTCAQQTAGCFRIIDEYLDRLRELGLYEDATIIITGDHAMMDDNALPLDRAFVTTLLVKEKGESSTPLKTSSAPVSQENFLPQIIHSAGISTEIDYGTPYSQVPADSTAPRYHYYQTWIGNGRENECYTYEINGSGLDFGNWEIVDHQTVSPIFW
ncbi:MAG: sulfatase-like hydrolase/transferase [Ruminococcus sp.]|nr:sulfatase-like hydrolase/transferase [Ruminococcus sp.]